MEGPKEDRAEEIEERMLENLADEDLPKELDPDQVEKKPRKLVWPGPANIHAPEIPEGEEYPEQELKFKDIQVTIPLYTQFGGTMPIGGSRMGYGAPGPGTGRAKYSKNSNKAKTVSTGVGRKRKKKKKK